MSVGMINQELTRPLAPERRERTPSRLAAAALRAVGAFSLAAVFGITGYVALTRDELGGEPFVVASIDRMAASGTVSPAPTEASLAAAEPTRDGRPAQQRQGAGELENDSGVKVVRPGGAAAPGSVVIRVPDAQASIRLAPANDRRVSERSRHGLLPKQGDGGLRPADVYARPVTAQQRNAPVRVAIVVGGLGIGVNTTQDAIQRLPSTISLAFAPYGNDVERLATRAREDGHEVLLQAPMEPFDYTFQ